MRVGFLITARLKSVRLPRKVVLPIQGKPVISLMIERLQSCPSLKEVIIATSTNPEDDPLCRIAEEMGVKYYRGSEHNVVERLLSAAKLFNLEYVVNVTADCPLVAIEFTEEIIKEYGRTNADLITTFDLPHGLYLYGLKVSALERVLALNSDTDTSAWGKYFDPTRGFKIHRLSIPECYKREGYRLTLDYPEDYSFFKEVYAGLGPGAVTKSSEEIIAFLDAHPEIVKINAHCAELFRKQFEEEYKYDPETLKNHG